MKTEEDKSLLAMGRLKSVVTIPLHRNLYYIENFMLRTVILLVNAVDSLDSLIPSQFTKQVSARQSL